MATLLQTHAIDFLSLSAKGLVNDLKEAVTCDVHNVCSLPCDRCPNMMNNIDLTKIILYGLNNYTIELIRQEDQQLLFNITAKNLDNWIAINHLDYQHSSKSQLCTASSEFSINL
jgi:hypothetical protein